MKENTLLAIITTAAMALTAGSALAQQRGEHHKPPQEAIEACADSQADDSCSFEGRSGSVEGTCFTPDEDKPFACKADQEPQGGQG